MWLSQGHSISELAQGTANNQSHSHTTESYCANSRKAMPVPFRAIGNDVSHEDNMKRPDFVVQVWF